ncbi:phosphotransferase family protein [Noviherbaspirillum sedimenti]|uniref:Phosphotransferase family protein n=1 Tax=Noviherbaspirillum sedimenti TaxID=2320865 RepID=A0A3A3FXF4_9BURK|nr:phosphotransferase family protein [Noviherbaspirillum sedimenti]RJG00827.1 phosphotransferase family protein [Noviherbaspirillum sedimenti]
MDFKNAGAAGMELDSPSIQERLTRYLLAQTEADHLAITGMARLSGGAIQENWALDITVKGGAYQGQQSWVLRTDAPSAVAVSLTRPQEFAVLSVAHSAGVTVPRPLWLCREPDVIGRDFFVMQRIAGIAAGHRLVREAELVPTRALLGEDLGANLAQLHTVRPPQPLLDFLPSPHDNHALATIAGYRRHLDELDAARPTLEVGLRWCELHAPASVPACLIHRDYRTGNYMVDHGRLSGVLDWEFAGWGEPLEDIGWFMARCWRFNANEREAGGVAHVEDFLRGYQRISGRSFTPDELRYWQVMAHLRWAVIALQQAQRHLSGKQPSLELALTGRLVADLEHEILNLTAGGVR